ATSTGTLGSFVSFAILSFPCCTSGSFFFFQAEDGIRDFHVTGVQTCALPICDEVYVYTGFFEGLGDITVVANNGFQLTNNVIGTSAKNINLQSDYGSIIASGSNTIVGNVSSAYGSINLTNTTIAGDVTTQSTLTSTGGSVSGDIVA